MKAATMQLPQQALDFSVGKWGNGLAMRLGKEAQRTFGVSPGDRLQGTFSASNGETILTLKVAKATKPRYTLKQLLAGCTSSNRHAEVWLDRTPAGREAGAAAPAAAPAKRGRTRK